MTTNQLEQIHEALLRSMCFVEDAILDEGYKTASVKRVLQQTREAVALVEAQLAEKE